MVNSKIAKQAIPQFLDISMNEFFSEYIHTVSNVACVLRLPLKKKKRKEKDKTGASHLGNLKYTSKFSNRRQEG